MKTKSACDLQSDEAEMLAQTCGPRRSETALWKTSDRQLLKAPQHWPCKEEFIANIHSYLPPTIGEGIEISQ